MIAQVKTSSCGRIYGKVGLLAFGAAPVRVLRGENSGETMSGNFAVRSLALMSHGQKTITLILPEGVNPARTHVAVLAHGDTPEILTADSLPWR